MNSNDLEEIKEIFSIFDSIGDGMISQSELGDALRALEQNPTEAEVRKHLEQFKPNERLSFEQFVPILQSIAKNKSKHKFDDFVEGLRHFDDEMTGQINGGALRRVLTQLGEPMTDAQVEDLLAGMEDDHGMVNYEELVKSVLSG